MVNSYYDIHQAERSKTTAGRVPGRTGRRMRADPSPLTTVPRPREDGEQEVMAPMQWRDVTVGGQDTTGLSLNLPCTEDPELFFAESPQDVEQAKAMCRDAGPGWPARPGRWSAGSPGASGAASC